VICFGAIFLHLMGRPKGRSLGEVAASYDVRWGRLRGEDMTNIIDTCGQLCRQRSVRDFLPLMLPGVSCDSTDLGELFLWAERYGRNRCMDCLAELILWAEKHGTHGCNASVSIPAAEWPQLHAPYPLLHEWRCAVGLSDRRLRPVLRRQQCRKWRPKHSGAHDGVEDSHFREVVHEELVSNAGAREETNDYHGHGEYAQWSLWLQWLQYCRHSEEEHYWRYLQSLVAPEYHEGIRYTTPR